LEDRTLPSTSIPLNATSWTNIGPAPVSSGGANSGRIAAIAGDPTNANIIYIASASGGVWKTIDAGNTWTPLTDNQITLNMGAIAIAPSDPNTIYAGTGEANLGPSKLAISRDNIYYGYGVLKSTDAGATWTLEEGNAGVDEFVRRTISRIVVDPANANTVYIAIGALATNGLAGNTGIWKSTDGGVSWVDTTASISTTAAYSDLTMDPSNDQILYAGVGDPNGNTANGIYKSTDGGNTWNLLSNFPHGSTDSNVGRIAIAIAKTSPLTLYASIAQSGANAVLYKMDKTTDGGNTWTQLTHTPNYMGTYGDYNDSLAVDPNNANTVYAGGQAGTDTLIRTTNGGTSWSDIGNVATGPHVDHHAAAFDANGKFLDGNDGGIWRLDNPTSVTWSDINGNLGTLQEEGFAQDPLNANVAYAGLQDNGTVKFNNSLSWNAIDGGDGGKALDDPVNDQIVYHDAAVASFGASAYIEKSTNGGNSFSAITNGINANNEPTIFYPPLVLDSGNHNILLTGTSRVYKTTNAGSQWTPISTVGVGGWTATTAINGLAIAPTNASTIYASAGGFIFVTTNNGASWTQTDPVVNPPSSLEFRGILVDPTAASVAYVVARGFSDATGGGQVWRTTNFGATWTNISGNLPDLPCWSIQLNPNAAGSADDVLYVGTDSGVYFSTNLGVTWTKMATGLPNVTAQTLDLRTGIGILGVGTNGRGSWEINLTHFQVTASASSVTAGAPFNLTVTALDPSNNVITNFSGTVHFTSSDTKAGLPSDYTFTPGDAGVHTFLNVALKKAGSQTIRAFDVGQTGAFGSVALTVTPGAATHFKLAAPGSVTAGTPFTVTVTALDAFGNTATGYLGTVNFTTTDPNHTLPPNYMFTAGDAGVHTFTNGVTLNTPGTQTLHVKDTVTGSIAGSAKITVGTLDPFFQPPAGISFAGWDLATLDRWFGLAATHRPGFDDLTGWGW
jgi:photosystem II stability/assembly factor-like uncharacterized protein